MIIPSSHDSVGRPRHNEGQDMDDRHLQRLHHLEHKRPLSESARENKCKPLSKLTFSKSSIKPL